MSQDTVIGLAIAKRLRDNVLLRLFEEIVVKVPLSWIEKDAGIFIGKMTALGYQAHECKREGECGGNYVKVTVDPRKYLCTFDSVDELFNRPGVVQPPSETKDLTLKEKQDMLFNRRP